MRIIAFIVDHNTIDKIIKHLKLSFIAERPPPPQLVQHKLLMSAEESGEHFRNWVEKVFLTEWRVEPILLLTVLLSLSLCLYFLAIDLAVLCVICLF